VRYLLAMLVLVLVACNDPTAVAGVDGVAAETKKEISARCPRPFKGSDTEGSFQGCHLTANNLPAGFTEVHWTFVYPDGTVVVDDFAYTTDSISWVFEQAGVTQIQATAIYPDGSEQIRTGSVTIRF
jgi:hypothetical protein